MQRLRKRESAATLGRISWHIPVPSQPRASHTCWQDRAGWKLQHHRGWVSKGAFPRHFLVVSWLCLHPLHSVEWEGLGCLFLQGCAGAKPLATVRGRKEEHQWDVRRWSWLMSWTKAEKCPCSHSRAPSDCAAMVGVGPDPALLSCCPLPWQKRAQIPTPAEQSSEQWSPPTYYSTAGWYGRWELMWCGWIQEPSATDRKINNFGKGGVDKQRLVESDWRIRNLHTQIPPLLQQPKSIPTIRASLLCVLHFPLKRHFREALLWLKEPAHPWHLLLPRLLPKRISGGPMKRCPALCSTSPLKPDSTASVRAGSLPQQADLASWKCCHHLSGGREWQNPVKGLFSPVILDSALKDWNVCPAWLHLIPASNTPPGSDFCSTNISVTTLQTWVRAQRTSQECAVCRMLVSMDSPRWSQCLVLILSWSHREDRGWEQDCASPIHLHTSLRQGWICTGCLWRPGKGNPAQQWEIISSSVTLRAHTIKPSLLQSVRQNDKWLQSKAYSQDLNLPPPLFCLNSF